MSIWITYSYSLWSEESVNGTYVNQTCHSKQKDYLKTYPSSLYLSI